MIMHAYEIDKDGFRINNYRIDGDVKIPNGCITVQMPQPLLFHRPKFNGVEWVEGETQSEREEREAQQLLDSLNPTERELSKAERELETIELLLEMGLL